MYSLIKEPKEIKNTSSFRNKIKICSYIRKSKQIKCNKIRANQFTIMFLNLFNMIAHFKSEIFI